jgi:hypothetical protein
VLFDTAPSFFLSFSFASSFSEVLHGDPEVKMLTDTPLDRVALYAALSGTLIGILFSLAGLVTTISEGEFCPSSLNK